MAYVEAQLKSLTGKACHGWQMLADGDRVAVGLSGGKDSLSLLWLLHERRRRIPIDFELTALHIDMGYGRVNQEELADFCRSLDVPFQVRHTDFGPRAHSEENRKNSPCFYCAMNRRRELFQMCDEFGCNKLALAHHQDDIHETFFMNLLYAGSVSTMLPVVSFFGGRVIVIRPLSLASAAMTRRFAEHMELPVQPPCCPSAGHTKRAVVGEMLEGYYRDNKKVRANLWRAITSTGLDQMPPPPSTMRKSRKK